MNLRRNRSWPFYSGHSHRVISGQVNYCFLSYSRYLTTLGPCRNLYPDTRHFRLPALHVHNCPAAVLVQAVMPIHHPIRSEQELAVQMNHQRWVGTSLEQLVVAVQS